MNASLTAYVSLEVLTYASLCKSEAIVGSYLNHVIVCILNDILVVSIAVTVIVCVNMLLYP